MTDYSALGLAIGELVERKQAYFWSKVQKSDGCWLWTGCTSDFGHGTWRAGGVLIRAHRASWLLHRGPIPDGMCVLHVCDVSACVRPDHLFLGTKADNTADMMAKGRGRFVSRAGERAGTARLTVAQVEEIRRLYGPPPGRGIHRGGPSQSELAHRYGVTQGTIGFIVRGETWR